MPNTCEHCLNSKIEIAPSIYKCNLDKKYHSYLDTCNYFKPGKVDLPHGFDDIFSNFKGKNNEHY
jgi:hypothetical protein